jgi:hypothetical protein
VVVRYPRPIYHCLYSEVADINPLTPTCSSFHDVSTSRPAIRSHCLRSARMRSYNTPSSHALGRQGKMRGDRGSVFITMTAWIVASLSVSTACRRTEPAGERVLSARLCGPDPLGLVRSAVTPTSYLPRYSVCSRWTFQADQCET